MTISIFKNPQEYFTTVGLLIIYFISISVSQAQYCDITPSYDTWEDFNFILADDEGNSYWTGSPMSSDAFYFFRYDGEKLDSLVYEDNLNIVRVVGIPFQNEEIYFEIVAISPQGVPEEHIYYLDNNVVVSATDAISGQRRFDLNLSEKGLPYFIHNEGSQEVLYLLSEGVANQISLQNGPYSTLQFHESISHGLYVYASAMNLKNLFHIINGVSTIITPTGGFNSLENSGSNSNTYFFKLIESGTLNEKLYAVNGTVASLISPTTFSWQDIDVDIVEEGSQVYFIANRGTKEHLYYYNGGKVSEIKPSGLIWDEYSFLDISEKTNFFFNATRGATKQTFSHDGKNITNITNSSASDFPDLLGTSSLGHFYVKYHIGQEYHLYYSSGSTLIATGNFYPDTLAYVHHIDDSYPFSKFSNLTRKLGSIKRHYIHDIHTGSFNEVVTGNTIETLLFNYYNGDSYYHATDVEGGHVIITGSANSMIENTPNFESVTGIVVEGFDSNGHIFVAITDSIKKKIYKVWPTQLYVNDGILGIDSKGSVYEAAELLSSDVTISNNDDVIFKTSEVIELVSAFTVEQGGVLEVQIVGCNN